MKFKTFEIIIIKINNCNSYGFKKRRVFGHFMYNMPRI